MLGVLPHPLTAYYSMAQDFTDTVCNVNTKHGVRSQPLDNPTPPLQNSQKQNPNNYFWGEKTILEQEKGMTCILHPAQETCIHFLLCN